MSNLSGTSTKEQQAANAAGTAGRDRLGGMSESEQSLAYSSTPSGTTTAWAGFGALGAPASVPLRGVNVNNEASLYIATSGIYNETTGKTFGNFACTRTANPLNSGPVWNRFTEDERDFLRMAKWGFNYCVFGLDWHWWGGSDSTTAQAIQAFAVTDQVVNWCKKYGMRVTFRMYVPRGGYQDYGSNGAQFWGSLTNWSNQNWNSTGTTPATQYMRDLRDWWAMFIPRYANEPAVVGYDLLNEASSGYFYDVVYWYYGAMIDYLTPLAPNQYFIIQSAPNGQWSGHSAIAKRSNVIYSFHFYGPIAVTTPDLDGPYLAYPGWAPDYDSLGGAGLNGAAISTGNINLSSLSGLPAGGGTAVIDNEAIVYSSIRAWQGGDPGASTTLNGRAANTMVVTTRGAQGTVAAAHGDKAGAYPGTVLNAAILSTDVMAGAGVVTFTDAASWAQFPATGYFTIDQEDFTYTGKGATTATGVTRAKDGTTAAAHAIGAIVRNAKYWNQVSTDNIFRAQGRLDLTQTPFEAGEAGSRKAAPGYRTWITDHLGLSNGQLNAAWISNWAFFNYREFAANFDFGLVIGNAGPFLGLVAQNPADMSSGTNPVVDTALVAALANLVPGNAPAGLLPTNQANVWSGQQTFAGGVLMSSALTAQKDLRRSRQTPTEAILVSGIDATAGELVGVTLTAARLIGAPLNPAVGQRLTFTLVQGGAGAFAVTWNAVFKVSWADTGNTTGKRSTISFVYDGTNWNQDGAQTPYV